MHLSPAERWIGSLLIGLLSVYVILRAALIPITYDEAATFFHYVNMGRFWPGTAHWDANNHILNSLLSILSFRMFGSAEFALRLPNVLAGVLYFSVCWKLSSLISDRTLRWALFLSLVTDHFILEFMSLSRGYGLSMALFTLSLYALYRWMTVQRMAYLVLALVAVQLATLANLSLLVLNLLVLTWTGYWAFFRMSQDRKMIGALWLASSACAGWFIHLSLLYKQKGLLYYGSDAGLWKVTALSLNRYAFAQLQHIGPYVLAALLMMAVYFTVRRLMQREIEADALFPYLLFVSLSGNQLMNMLLDVNFPEDRVAMHYLVLLPICVIFLADAAQLSGSLMAKGSAALLCTIPLNTVLSANLTHVELWREDASARRFYEQIVAYADSTGTEPTVAGYYLRDLPFYYYNYRNNARLSIIQNEASHGDEADFVYADLDENGPWDLYHIFGSDESAGLHLLRTRSPRARTLWFSHALPEVSSSTEPYLVWYEVDIDSMANKDLLWQIEVEMPELNRPFPAWITTVLGTADGKDLMQETIVLDRLKPSWKHGELLRQQIMLPNIPQGATHVKLFFWNIEQQPISIGKVHISLYELTEHDTD